MERAGKEGPAAQSDDNDDDEEQIEEIAPFDERVRLFANAPRSPPAMSASYLAPSYAPLLSIDTVRAHVLPTDATQFTPIYPPSLHQSTSYSAPLHQHQLQQQLPASSPPSNGGVQTGVGFATPASLSLMLPPATAPPTGQHSAANTAGGGFMSQLTNNLLSFATSPSLQLQQAVSMSPSPHYAGSTSLGLAMHSSINQSHGQHANGYTSNGVHLSPMQLTAASNGLPMSALGNMQLANMQAAMQQQLQQHQPHQLLPHNGVLSQHSLSHFLPSTVNQHSNILSPPLHTLSSLSTTMSVPHSLSTAAQQLQLLQPTPLFANSSTHPTASNQPYSTSLASPFLHPALPSTAQYVSYSNGGPSSAQMLSLPQLHSLSALPASSQSSVPLM